LALAIRLTFTHHPCSLHPLLPPTPTLTHPHQAEQQEALRQEALKQARAAAAEKAAAEKAARAATVGQLSRKNSLARGRAAFLDEESESGEESEEEEVLDPAAMRRRMMQG
jgi:hypothetical protein